MKVPWLAATLAVALGMPLGASGGSDRADVALVLAIDVSGSVDDNRFKLQREGIAAALESEEVAAAVLSGANQTVEMAAVEWAEEQHLLVPWTVLRGRTTSPPWLPACAARAGPGCIRRPIRAAASLPPHTCSPTSPLSACGR
jgi:hypothetical protein